MLVIFILLESLINITNELSNLFFFSFCFIFYWFKITSLHDILWYIRVLSLTYISKSIKSNLPLLITQCQVKGKTPLLILNVTSQHIPPVSNTTFSEFLISTFVSNPILIPEIKGRGYPFLYPCIECAVMKTEYPQRFEDEIANCGWIDH